MKTFYNFSYLILISLFSISCNKIQEKTALIVTSPSGDIAIGFLLSPDGSPKYYITHKNESVIDTSSMGFDFKDQPSFDKGFKLIGSSTDGIDETWDMPWGEQLSVRNNYNELVVNLQESAAPNHKLNIYFKAYDDGIGFRYEFPEQQGVDSLIIMDENTQFNLTTNPTVWWIPGDWDIYEHLYNTTKFNKINAITKRDHRDLAQTYIPENAVNTPVTMRTDSGLHLTFHEANLTNYADMTLKVDTTNLSMTSELVGSDRLGYKVKRALPFKTPWRTIIIAEKATDLIASKLILNLNEPNKLGDVSWFKPEKYVGIWWEMHIGKSTWDYAASQDMNSFTTDSKPHGKHGATTKNTMHYIDFAAKNNIGGVLVEGWNTGWEHWIGFEDREGVFDFITPYPDYDLKKIVEYGKEKGVNIIMHHETSAAPRTYEKQMDTAYA